MNPNHSSIITDKEKSYILTSESVAAGHPDKICDQISDALLDYCLVKDKAARVSVECLAVPKNVIIAGEIGSNYQAQPEEFENIIRQTIKEVGYHNDNFNWQDIKITSFVHKQSQEIANSVIKKGAKSEGAGDQGIMFGYACNETKNLMPAPIYYAHKILRVIDEAIKKGEVNRLGPDGKSQVSLAYDRQTQMPYKATAIVVSIQHAATLTQTEVKELIKPYIIQAMPEGWVTEETNLLINPSGSFVLGGPQSDAGLTGRKIIVDTYGGAVPHGGGAFSGKDPSKVDRSGAYMARFVAKNIVASEIADKCLIQLSYAIGVSHPVSFYINTFGTSQVDDTKLTKIVLDMVDFSPRGIRNRLQLDKPIYKVTATFGHFGRAPQPDGSFSWEKTDWAQELKSALKSWF
jgi:S-adenosylmethionine synthetase